MLKYTSLLVLQSLNGPTYVCANSNGTFKFFTTFLNNNELVMTSVSWTHQSLPARCSNKELTLSIVV